MHYRFSLKLVPFVSSDRRAQRGSRFLGQGKISAENEFCSLVQQCVDQLVAGSGGEVDPGSRGESLGEWIYRVISQSIARRISGTCGIRDCGGCPGEGVMVPPGIQYGTPAQLIGVRDTEGLQRGLRW